MSKNYELTPQAICTAPKDGTPILVWDGEWNAWVAARWLDSGGWYGDHDCSWKGNCLDARTPQWWIPMPPEPTKALNGKDFKDDFFVGDCDHTKEEGK